MRLPPGYWSSQRHWHSGADELAGWLFPKADIEKTTDGYDVELRDLRYAGIGETQREILARIELDANGKLLNDELIWARNAKRH